LKKIYYTVIINIKIKSGIIQDKKIRLLPGVRGSMEEINGLIGYTGDKPIGTGFMEGATVECRFKKGTRMSGYTRKLSAYYSSEDNPISQEKAMQRLCEANGGITPAELQEKVNRGEPINEPADMSWNKDVQKMYVSKPITASEMSNAEYMQRFREAEERAKNSDPDSNLKKLTDLARQNGGGSEYVREELEKALKNIPEGDKLDIDKIIETSCVSLSVWVELKQSGANVGEYGEFYAEQVNKGNITAENAAVNKIIDAASSYTIDGKKPIVGFTRDFTEYEKLMSSGKVESGVVFSKQISGYHALNAYSSNEGIKISDVSYRTHGNFASEYVDNKNYRWLFYVKKRGK
jgi:hypothetical protein